MSRILFALIAAATACGLAAIAWAQPTPTNPVLTVTTVPGNTATLIIAANPTRRSIRICNTGATNAVWIWPGSATIVSDYILAAVASSVITCYTPPSGITASPNATANNSFYAYTGVTAGTTVSVEEW